MDVEFINVCKKYNNHFAVKNLNLKIQSRDIHFLLGPSGCGKTTALRMLAGLEQPTSGQIKINGEDCTDLSSEKRGIGLVFQNYALWPHMTVKENILYALKIQKVQDSIMRERLDKVLTLTRLAPMQEKLPGQLSGGQQQRVALARALAIEPKILLLDEPLSNLDAALRQEIRENIYNIHKHTQITMLYVTHDQKEALSLASKMTVMRQGEVIRTGTPRELYENPDEIFLATFLGETNLIEGQYLHKKDNEHYFTTDLGILRVKAQELEIKAQQKRILSIRPEVIALRTETQESNKVKVKIQRSTFFGEYEQHDATYSDGKDLKIFSFPTYMDTLDPKKVEYCFISPKQINVLNMPQTA